MAECWENFLSSTLNRRLFVACFLLCFICKHILLSQVTNTSAFVCATLALFLCFNSASFEKAKEAILPSFLRLLVTGDQSSQIHPALLWWRRIRESLRLQNTSRAQQTRLSLFTLRMTNGNSNKTWITTTLLLSHGFRTRSSGGNWGVMHSVPLDTGGSNANGDENLYCFVQLMHTVQRYETWILPVKLQAAQLITGSGPLDASAINYLPVEAQYRKRLSS